MEDGGFPHNENFLGSDIFLASIQGDENSTSLGSNGVSSRRPLNKASSNRRMEQEVPDTHLSANISSRPFDTHRLREMKLSQPPVPPRKRSQPTEHAIISAPSSSTGANLISRHPSYAPSITPNPPNIPQDSASPFVTSSSVNFPTEMPRAAIATPNTIKSAPLTSTETPPSTAIEPTSSVPRVNTTFPLAPPQPPPEFPQPEYILPEIPVSEYTRPLLALPSLPNTTSQRNGQTVPNENIRNFSTLAKNLPPLPPQNANLSSPPTYQQSQPMPSNTMTQNLIMQPPVPLPTQPTTNPLRSMPLPPPPTNAPVPIKNTPVPQLIAPEAPNYDPVYLRSGSQTPFSESGLYSGNRPNKAPISPSSYTEGPTPYRMPLHIATPSAHSTVPATNDTSPAAYDTLITTTAGAAVTRVNQPVPTQRQSAATPQQPILSNPSLFVASDAESIDGTSNRTALVSTRSIITRNGEKKGIISVAGPLPLNSYSAQPQTRTKYWDEDDADVVVETLSLSKDTQNRPNTQNEGPENVNWEEIYGIPREVVEFEARRRREAEKATIIQHDRLLSAGLFNAPVFPGFLGRGVGGNGKDSSNRNLISGNTNSGYVPGRRPATTKSTTSTVTLEESTPTSIPPLRQQAISPSISSTLRQTVSPSPFTLPGFAEIQKAVSSASMLPRIPAPAAVVETVVVKNDKLAASNIAEDMERPHAPANNIADLSISATPLTSAQDPGRMPKSSGDVVEPPSPVAIRLPEKDILNSHIESAKAVVSGDATAALMGTGTSSLPARLSSNTPSISTNPAPTLTRSSEIVPVMTGNSINAANSPPVSQVLPQVVVNGPISSNLSSFVGVTAVPMGAIAAMTMEQYLAYMQRQSQQAEASPPPDARLAREVGQQFVNIADIAALPSNRSVLPSMRSDYTSISENDPSMEVRNRILSQRRNSGPEAVISALIGQGGDSSVRPPRKIPEMPRRSSWAATTEANNGAFPVLPVKDPFVGGKKGVIKADRAVEKDEDQLEEEAQLALWKAKVEEMRRQQENKDREKIHREETEKIYQREQEERKKMEQRLSTRRLSRQDKLGKDLTPEKVVNVGSIPAELNCLRNKADVSDDEDEVAGHRRVSGTKTVPEKYPEKGPRESDENLIPLHASSAKHVLEGHREAEDPNCMRQYISEYQRRQLAHGGIHGTVTGLPPDDDREKLVREILDIPDRPTGIPDTTSGLSFIQRDDEYVPKKSDTTRSLFSRLSSKLFRPKSSKSRALEALPAASAVGNIDNLPSSSSNEPTFLRNRNTASSARGYRLSTAPSLSAEHPSFGSDRFDIVAERPSPEDVEVALDTDRDDSDWERAWENRRSIGDFPEVQKKVSSLISEAEIDRNASLRDNGDNCQHCRQEYESCTCACECGVELCRTNQNINREKLKALTRKKGQKERSSAIKNPDAMRDGLESIVPYISSKKLTTKDHSSRASKQDSSHVPEPSNVEQAILESSIAAPSIAPSGSRTTQRRRSFVDTLRRGLEYGLASGLSVFSGNNTAYSTVEANDLERDAFFVTPDLIETPNELLFNGDARVTDPVDNVDDNDDNPSDDNPCASDSVADLLETTAGRQHNTEIYIRSQQQMKETSVPRVSSWLGKIIPAKSDSEPTLTFSELYSDQHIALYIDGSNEYKQCFYDIFCRDVLCSRCGVPTQELDRNGVRKRWTMGLILGCETDDHNLETTNTSYDLARVGNKGRESVISEPMRLKVMHVCGGDVIILETREGKGAVPLFTHWNAAYKGVTMLPAEIQAHIASGYGKLSRAMARVGRNLDQEIQESLGISPVPDTPPMQQPILENLDAAVNPTGTHQTENLMPELEPLPPKPAKRRLSGIMDYLGNLWGRPNSQFSESAASLDLHLKEPLIFNPNLNPHSKRNHTTFNTSRSDQRSHPTPVLTTISNGTLSSSSSPLPALPFDSASPSTTAPIFRSAGALGGRGDASTAGKEHGDSRYEAVSRGAAELKGDTKVNGMLLSPPLLEIQNSFTFDENGPDKMSTTSAEDIRAPQLYRRKVVCEKGDGHCLFRAISRAIYGNPSFYRYIREGVAQWLWVLRSEYGDFIPGSVDEYVSKLERSSWGGELELRLIADIYNVKIVVHKEKEKETPEFNVISNLLKSNPPPKNHPDYQEYVSLFGIPEDEEPPCGHVRCRARTVCVEVSGADTEVAAVYEPSALVRDFTECEDNQLWLMKQVRFVATEQTLLYFAKEGRKLPMYPTNSQIWQSVGNPTSEIAFSRKESEIPDVSLTLYRWLTSEAEIHLLYGKDHYDSLACSGLQSTAENGNNGVVGMLIGAENSGTGRPSGSGRGQVCFRAGIYECVAEAMAARITEMMDSK